MSGDLVLRNARVWARPDAEISAPQDLLLRERRIERLGPALSVDAPGAEVFDVQGRVVTAGFWNCHVHLTEPVWSAADEPDRHQGALDDMLLCRGFTGAIDLGSRLRTTTRLAARIDRGELHGPRILTAGAGLHPWRGTPFYLRPRIPWFLRWVLPMPLTPAGARRTVRAQARSGAGVIKLFTGSHITPQTIRPMRRSVARAAVAEAHRHGLTVFAHPGDREGVSVALDAGVDVLAHVPDRIEGTVPLLREAARRGIRLVPTLHMFASTVSTEESYLRPVRQALRTFREAGGTVLFGTDVGYMPDRDTRPEYAALAASGMSSADILRSLTVEPARLLGRDDTGIIAAGQRADLTILTAGADLGADADPSTGVPAPEGLADVCAVVRGGEVLWHGSQRRPGLRL